MADTAIFTLGKVVGPPLPPEPEHTTYVDAGPVSVGVEYRVVDVPKLTDRGFSLHVCDRATGAEYLRFDLFEDEPHYHYIRPGRENRVVLYDANACGPMFDWAVTCLRERLPAMLRYAGADELAEATAGPEYGSAVDGAVARIRELAAGAPR